MKTSEQTGSAGKLGPLLATMLVAGNIIGSGIFLLPSTLASAGGIALAAWGLAVVGAGFLAYVIAELADLRPMDGGITAYAGDMFGPLAGFQASFFYWLSAVTGNIAIVTAVVGYLAVIVPAAGTPAAAPWVATGIVWLFTIANLFGPVLVGRISSATLLIGLAPVLFVALVGWYYFDAALFLRSWHVPGISWQTSLPGTLVLVFWAFMGLESASVASHVMRDRLTVLIATVAGVAIAGLLYLAANTVMLGLLPLPDLARSTAPFADVVARVAGPGAGLAIALCALVKGCGTLGGWILVTGECAAAAAKRGLFPQWLARADRCGICRLNLLATAVLMTLIIFATRSPSLGQQFGKLIEIATLLCLFVYLFPCAAAWRYTARLVGARRALIRAAATLAAIFCIGVILGSSPHQLLVAIAIAIGTAPVFLIARKLNLIAPDSPEHPSPARKGQTA